MTYRKRLTLLVLLDIILILAAIGISVWLVNPVNSEYSLFNPVVMISSIALIVFHFIYAYANDLYNKVWSYASVGELSAIVISVTLAVISTGIVQLFVNNFTLYRRGLVTTWLLYIVFIGGSRFLWRIYRDRYIKNVANKKRTLIVGAGDAGAMVIRQVNHANNDSDIYPVVAVDDDNNKQRMQLYNVPVVGKVEDIPQVVEKYNISLIVIAIPSLKNGELNSIVSYCHQTKAKVQMIPKLEDLMMGKISVSHLKNVEVEDLLGRKPVDLDINMIEQDIKGETVMVTGAGGSIGSELCRQLMAFNPGKIILVGHGEFSIYSIDVELKNTYPEKKEDIIPVIGDIKDRKRMLSIVGTHQPSIIYHAAAHKHVPLMESNPHEAVKNNILGTRNVAEAAGTHKVPTFILVSTDKAVNPTNVMGASKRVAEMVVQNLNRQFKTTFAAVRFGNVLGSRGSVIPLFKKQIEEGGPVTVTHQDMTRYFMTIPEASRLVIQAGALANGGEVFVLDMGEPVKIVDLAKNLIKLSGYTEEDIDIQFSGIRPGEKMYEELLGEDEILPGQVYEKIYVGRTVLIEEEMITTLINTYRELDRTTLKERLMDIVYYERTLLEEKVEPQLTAVK